MNLSNRIIVLVLILFSASACEDVIKVDLDEGAPQLVVDAWINNQDETQMVRLRTTSPYFDPAPSPIVTGATVNITDDKGNVFPFVDPDNNGDYTWEPGAVSIGTINTVYTLEIEVDGETYTANSTLTPVPPIDSIATTFEESELGSPEGIYAEFFARDIPGRGNTYWIKTYKNGLFLNKPQEINIAYDAAFSAGAETDGLIFIPPIRSNINRFPDTADGAEDNDDKAPWEVGDSIRVEIHSVTNEAFYFLEQAATQMTLGDAGIFAEPLSNVTTNISNTNANSDKQAVGFFCMSSISKLGKRVE